MSRILSGPKSWMRPLVAANGPPQASSGLPSSSNRPAPPAMSSPMMNTSGSRFNSSRKVWLNVSRYNVTLPGTSNPGPNGWDDHFVGACAVVMLSVPLAIPG